jgi:hypothetical protein
MYHFSIPYDPHIQGIPGGKVIILGDYSIGHCKQKIYMYMCPIPKGVNIGGFPF